MYDLTLIKQDGSVYIDSREVAAAIGKNHKDLLRDIRGYISIMEKTIERNFAPNEFFIESSYVDSIGRTLPCYLLSKSGCEVCANKLNGERGVLFTCAYVTKFNLMEQERLAERETELEALALEHHKPEPRLGEINACSRLMVMGMKAVGATSEQVMKFLAETYAPLGFDLDFEVCGETVAPRWRNANGIAKECGMYSLSGKPHGQAAASILKEILFIGEEHMRYEKDYYGFQVGISTLYDDYALLAILEWLGENKCPDDIEVSGRTFHIQYQF